MRYPYHSSLSSWQKFAMFGFAITLFSGALTIAVQTRFPIQASHYRGNVAGLATETQPVQQTVTFKLFNAGTVQPIIHKSIVVTPTLDCDMSTTCPAPSPLVLVTDSEGKVKIDKSLTQHRPKLYVTGFRIDRYFGYITPSMPDTLTVYEPLPGLKTSYDTTREEIPLGLEPIEP